MMDEKAADYVNEIVKDEDDVVDTLRLYEAYRDGYSAGFYDKDKSTMWIFIIAGAFACFGILSLLNQFGNYISIHPNPVKLRSSLK